MAFYKDFTNKGTRDEKRRAAESRGGFHDEGAQYGGARSPRGGSRPPRGDRPSFGDHPPRGDRPAFDSRPPRGDRPSSGDRPPRGDRPSFDSRPPRSDRPSFDSRPPRGDRPSFDNRPPRGDRPAFGDRPPRGDRPSFGDRPPRGDRPSFDSRPPRGDRPSFDSRPLRGDRPSFDNRPPRGGRPSFDNRPPRGDRPSFDNRPPRGGKPSFDSRPPRGDRPESDGNFRFSSGGQDTYRSRGADVASRPYEERQRERREGPAPRDYNSFRYEAPARPPRPTYDAPEPAEEEAVPPENLLSGRNPIREALKSGRDIEKLMVARGDLSGSAREIIAMAKERHVPVQEVDRARLDAITEHHQGMLAFASAYRYHTVEEMLALAAERGEAPFLVVLDGVTDPHNLGAIIRTAECAGAHGVIVQERRAVGLTPAAVKASAGAIEHIMVARVTNLTSTLESLKKQGIWIYAADMAGEDYMTVDFKGGAAVVIGAEGEGVSRLVLENADKRVSLPVRGKLDSLNASVAAGILLYAVLRFR